MTRTCLRSSMFFHSRKRYEGYIPRSCSIPFFQTGSPSPPLVLGAASGLVATSHVIPHDTPQRSEEWFSLRREKLTTSTFSTALGFWKAGRRHELWREKVFTLDANVSETTGPAMDWGVHNEPAAIERYKSITGREVGIMGFAVHPDTHLSWLGASPDGLLGNHPDGGILEVKCPYNNGKPEVGLPWKSMPYYYMPQVQGQMEIMDRDWVDLYCWTPSASALFRVFRDRVYFGLMKKVIHDFWWGSVIPARAAVLMGSEEVAKDYGPADRHRLTGVLIGRSRKLAEGAQLVFRDIDGHLEFFR